MKHDYTAWRNLDPAIETKGGATDIIVKAVNDLGEISKKKLAQTKTFSKRRSVIQRPSLKKTLPILIRE
jgi:hypothetical protein